MCCLFARLLHIVFGNSSPKHKIHYCEYIPNVLYILLSSNPSFFAIASSCPTRNEDDGSKEIYMFDIATQRVSKLSGELSSAFVNVAEENANAQDIENSSMSDSGIVEHMAPQSRNGDDNDAAETSDDPDDSEAEPSHLFESIVAAPPGFAANNIQINSGYSVIS